VNRTALILAGVAVLAACFGATLARQRSSPAAASATTQQADLQRIDQSKVLPLEPQRVPEDFGKQAMAHVEALVAFGPRNPGRQPTPGWSRQLEYIAGELQRAGLVVQRDTWTDRKELITFTNLSATIPGKQRERIVLACHHDTKCTSGHADPSHNFDFVGANDGGSGVAMLLTLAPLLRARTNQATIELVFFDGEECLDWNWGDGSRALFGSKRFSQRHRDAHLLGQEPRIAALVLLDMVGRTDLHIQEETFSTLQLRRVLWSAAVACGHQTHFFQRAEAASDDHKPFLDVGIPAVDLIDLNGNPHWHRATDVVANMSPRSLQLVGDVVLTMLPEIERAYARSGD